MPLNTQVAPSEGSVFWVGQNGNVYYKNNFGTHDLGELKDINRSSGNFSADLGSVEGSHWIADPNTQSGSYSTGGGGGGTTNSADLAYLDDLQGRYLDQRASANKAQSNGLLSLNDSYNRQVSDANQDQSRAMEDFDLKEQDTLRDKTNALERTNSNGYSLANSLRRRIGMASGSGSSAYQIAAPNAVAREVSSDRGQLQEDYGVNFRNLGLARDRTKSDYDQYLEDLLGERRSRESDFKAGILDRKNQIDTTLSEIARQRALLNGGGYDQVREALAPYASNIESRQNSIDSLFDRYRTPYNIKPVEVKTPQLRDYVVGSHQIGQQAAQNSPYAQALNNRTRDKDEQGLFA